MPIQSYRDLKVWQKGMDLVIESYKLTRSFPKSETYGLTTQIQRAAISIPANIAEGHGRDHLGDYLHHLSIANGSLMELETHLLIAERLGYLDATQLEYILHLGSEVGRMLSGLSKGLKKHRTSCGLTPDTSHLTPDT